VAHPAGRVARVDAGGQLVLLDDQDRTLWDQRAIAHAMRVTTRALRLGPPGRYVLQAGIAVEHSAAPTAAHTRWERIAAFYDRLAALAPDPVVELNRAVAIAQAGDVAGGLARIDALSPALDGYHYFHAARAELLGRLGARVTLPPAPTAVPLTWRAAPPSVRSSSAGSPRHDREAACRRGPRALMRR
jgi:RNA polymerase sigma-70 factor (ECF subfamily)